MMPKFSSFAPLDHYPGVVKCLGGWFAVRSELDCLGSGPWRSKDAAEAALARDYSTAHKLDDEGFK